MADILLERAYDHDVSTVWVALSDRDALSSWFMPTADFTPEVGAPVTFEAHAAPGFATRVRGAVLEVEPMRRLAFGWRGVGVDTVVTFELASPGERTTTLRVAHTGFDGVRGAVMSRVLRRGWQRLLDTRLPAAVLLLTNADPTELSFELVAAAAGDRQDGLDVAGLLRRWTDV